MNAGKEGQRGRIILGGVLVCMFIFCVALVIDLPLSLLLLWRWVFCKEMERESRNEMATVQFHTSQVTAIHKMNSKLHRPIKLLQRETEQASKIK